MTAVSSDRQMSQSADNGSPAERPGDRTNDQVSRRAQLPIPVRAKIGQTESQDRRLRDVSVSGFRIDWPAAAEVGETVLARFQGYPGVCPAFILHGRVARFIAGESPELGIALDREESSPEALEHYRQLVLHYLRHKPLLGKLRPSFFEGRCEACGWLGRVGARTPVCPRCSGRVGTLDPGQ
jgi:hypothetical protein